MNLNKQDTQPQAQGYRMCVTCGGVFFLKKKTPLQRFCSQPCSTSRCRINPEPSPDEISEGSRRITLTQGQWAIVDAEDYEWLNQWPWYAAWRRKTRSFVVVRNGDASNGSRKTVYMSREIMRAPEGVLVDHHNHDTLNNRRYNLRLATGYQNQRNATKHRKTSSRFKGVCWHKGHRKWESHIRIDGHQLHIGSFDSEREAAEAYRNAAQEAFGEFAYAPYLSDSIPKSAVESQ